MCRSYEWQKEHSITCTKCGCVILDTNLKDHESKCMSTVMDDFKNFMKGFNDETI